MTSPGEVVYSAVVSQSLLDPDQGVALPWVMPVWPLLPGTPYP